MSNLTRAHRELFRREPDERFSSLETLTTYCRQQRDDSCELWWQPDRLATRPVDTQQLNLEGADGAQLRLTEWSFSQLCALCGVHKGTVNRLQANTAGQIFRETLPAGNKPIQVLSTADQARSIHGASYTRLFNAELLDVVADCADGFEPPPKGINGATGLYCGEQDLFIFLIDPTGWVEINGESFAPGFFCWNSEVGKRSLGLQTFWFQSVCANHLVWDPIETVEFSRRHTANIHESLDLVRDLIGNLVKKRDKRRDGFAQAIKMAMGTRFAESADEAIVDITRQGLTRTIAAKAIELSKQRGALTIFSVVDALTQLSQKSVNAGDRTLLDQKAAGLLALAV